VQNISQYDSGEQCGPWASCVFFFKILINTFDSLKLDAKFRMTGGSLPKLLILLPKGYWYCPHGRVNLEYSIYVQKACGSLVVQ
jgi:hypothetical protein